MLSISGVSQGMGPCATGFTRVSPYYCQVLNRGGAAAWSHSTSCTANSPSSGASTVPASAKFVRLYFEWFTKSANAIGGRSNNIVFYADSSCAGVSPAFTEISLREFAAVSPVDSNIGETVDTQIVPVVSGNVYSTSGNTGGTGNAYANYTTLGYFDGP